MEQNLPYVELSLKKMFSEFDTNKNAELERNEIRDILRHVFKTMGINK